MTHYHLIHSLPKIPEVVKQLLSGSACGWMRFRPEFFKGGLRISSLFFANDVVLLASSSNNLQLALGSFASKLEVTWVIIREKSLARFLSWKRVEKFGYECGEIWVADDRRLTRSGADSVSVCCGEEQARYKSETVNLPIDLHSYSQQALCSNRNNEKGWKSAWAQD